MTDLLSEPYPIYKACTREHVLTASPDGQGGYLLAISAWWSGTLCTSATDLNWSLAETSLLAPYTLGQLALRSVKLCQSTSAAHVSSTLLSQASIRQMSLIHPLCK